MADKAEAKLGKSLDQIIEENRKKLTTNKPRSRGTRVDNGPRPGASRGGATRAPPPARTPRALAVQGGGIGKRRGGGGGGAAASFMHDDRTGPVGGFDDDEYGSGGRGGRGGRGDRPQGGRRAGNVEGAWSHDLYDEGPPARRGAGAGPRAPPARDGPAGPADPACKLLVDNLAYKVTEQDLQELFQSCGNVQRVRIQFARDGRPTGRATVLFSRPQEVRKAIKEYNGVKLDTMELELKSAEDIAPAGGAPRSAAGGPPRLSSGLVVQKPGSGRVGGGGGGAGGAGGRMFQQAVPRGMESGRRGGRGGGRLRSSVARTREDLDAEMDSMME